LLGDLTRAKTAIVHQANICSNVSLYGAAGYGKHTLGRMIQLNTATPYKM
jgi:replication-associated recombination protein RarA